jgi:hypothetical protein
MNADVYGLDLCFEPAFMGFYLRAPKFYTLSPPARGLPKPAGSEVIARGRRSYEREAMVF